MKKLDSCIRVSPTFIFLFSTVQMSLRGRQPEAISCFTKYFWQMRIAAPPKSKIGGSQRHDFMGCTVENFSLNKWRKWEVVQLADRKLEGKGRKSFDIKGRQTWQTQQTQNSNTMFSFGCVSFELKVKRLSGKVSLEKPLQEKPHDFQLTKDYTGYTHRI